MSSPSSPRRPTIAAVAIALVGLWLSGAVRPAAAQLEPFDDRRPVQVTVDVDRSDESIRLLLTHSADVVYAIRQVGDRIEIVYAAPIRLDPPQERLGGRVLERYRVRGGRTLELRTGPDLEDFSSFELRNPFRLILDLTGTEHAPPLGTFADPPPVRPRGRVLVIDPGHGGIEEGAVGPTGLKEKDLTLDMARRLRRRLARRGQVDVVLTRDEDRLVGLDERTAIANYNRAALFVSLHLNASPRSEASGAETYYLSTDATDDQARTLAALENRSSGVSDAVAADDPGLDLVLWELAQNRYLAESAALAEWVQRELDRMAGTRDRGVRQAPFRVLMGATMPAILVEAGFISNPAEERRLRAAAYRERIVEAIAVAIEEYLLQLDRVTAGEVEGGPTGVIDDGRAGEAGGGASAAARRSGAP